VADDLDIVVFGASGVTGRQVAGYLAERAQEVPLRWAVAGRDERKVALVLEQTGVRAPETIRADVADAASLAGMADRARVVLNLVGPYTRYGRPVIGACLAAGAHYVDLTGELPFVREMIDAFDAEAAAAGVKIVEVCGFEALPADLLVALLAERVRALWDEGLQGVDLEVQVSSPPGLPHASDAISGGTFQSLASVMAADDAGRVADPALLIADQALAAPVRARSPIGLGPRRGFSGAVIAPMAPAPFINPAVIHRSAALRALAENRTFAPFRYREGIALPGGPVTLPARWAIGGALSGTMVGMRALAKARPQVRGPLSSAMARLGPSSGFGPTGERLERWRWRMSARAMTDRGRTFDGVLDADGHPGYLATARLLGEAGMLLSEQGATPAAGGCLTPAAALGTEHLDRFARAGLRFRSGEEAAAAAA
jgi:short subunit dehydrogenase-like uncharacterized protein